MKCQEVMELMQRYMDGDLDQHETSLMLDHVGTCPDCAAMLRRLQLLSDGLTQLPRVMPKFSLVDAILPQLDQLDIEPRPMDDERGMQPADEPGSASKAGSRSERPTRRWLRSLSGVVALGLTVGAIIFAQNNLSSSKNNHNDAASMPGTAKVMDTQEDTNQASAMYTTEAPDVSITSKQQGLQDPEAGGIDGDSSTNDAPIAIQGIAPQDSGGGEFAPDMSAESTSTMRGTQNNSLQGNDQISSFKAASPAVLLSPDGQWRAVINGGSGQLQVYAVADDRLVFESEPREGSISQLVWEPESRQLLYDWTDPSGQVTPLAFDTSTLKETGR